MSLPPTWIPGDITLRKAANDYFAALGRALPAGAGRPRHARGHDLPVGPAAHRPEHLGRRPGAGRHDRAERLQTISPDESGAAALHRLATTAADELAVVQDGRFIGFIDRLSIGRYLQTGHAPRHPAHDGVGV